MGANESLSEFQKKGQRLPLKQSPILIYGRKGNPGMDFLMVIIASGLLMGTYAQLHATAAESCKMVVILLQIYSLTDAWTTLVYYVLL